LEYPHDATLDLHSPDDTIEYPPDVDTTNVNAYFHRKCSVSKVLTSAPCTHHNDQLHDYYNLINHSDDMFNAQLDSAFLLQARHVEQHGGLPWSSSDSHWTIPGPFRTSRCFYFSALDGEIFSVSSDDILSEADIAKYWHLVDAADRAEIDQFVDYQVFKARKWDDTVHNVIDGVWVRRWKDKAKLILKCRLCGRGFLDSQKSAVQRHSSTASRLSHKLACALGVQLGFTFETIDISGAFLQGLRFDELAKRAAELGYETPKHRAVCLAPPRNVWRHLRSNPKSHINIIDSLAHLWLLECLKAMYGLVDAPLLWQLALLHYLRIILHGVCSQFDTNLCTGMIRLWYG